MIREVIDDGRSGYTRLLGDVYTTGCMFRAFVLIG
jgi:hypothetical protein